MTEPTTPFVTIMEWQKAFREQPRIYWTEGYCECWESTGSFYDSAEAAQTELDFAKRHKRRLRLCSANIHTAELSAQRWSGFTAYKSKTIAVE